MKKNADTRFAALLLPLLLLLAQGGSCERGASNVNNRNAGVVARAATPTPVGDDRTKGGSEVGQKTADRKVAAGTWGGRSVRLTVTDGGNAAVEFDCAHGTLKELQLDAGGSFDVAGTFVAEGGPAREDEGEQPKGKPARYSGQVEGDRMTLRVRLEGSDVRLPSFTLTRGEQGSLTKCQ
ncbi:MAG TPA: hypothetical protein VGV38_13580 [Pyrinomonadaceae bacterium]|nr:hypothetical protein [Pyrinomonadaceae bacterium]